MTHHVLAHGRIRRRRTALFRTALTCGQTSARACSSRLTTSLNLHRSAGTGFGGCVRHGLRALGSNASRLIVGLVSPHREQASGPHTVRAPPWRPSCRAVGRPLAPMCGRIPSAVPWSATCATQLARARTADVDVRSARFDLGAVSHRSCTRAAPTPDSWSPGPPVRSD